MSAAAPPDDPRLGVYVHWPYCAAICPYCDFNVYRDRGRDRAALLAAIAADMPGWAERMAALGRLAPADSVFFGGGTPSLLTPDDVAGVLAAVEAAFGLSAGAEVSLEANPEDADPAYFAALRAAGVTRLSLGVQALEDGALTALGRAHDAAAARRAVALAAAAFPEVTLDLIYAREGQSLARWGAELGEALALGATHLSLYQLTIEPGTAFAKRVERGQLTPPTPDAAADFYGLTQELTAAAGYPAYEVSNHARSAGDGRPKAHHSQHNLLYWRSREWVGVGPGAHGRIGALGGARTATEAARRPADYIAAVAAQGWGVVREEAIAPGAQLDEAVLMGLRLAEGLDFAALQAAFGVRLDETAVAVLEGDGLLTRCGGRLVVPRAQAALTDRIALEVLNAIARPDRLANAG